MSTNGNIILIGVGGAGCRIADFVATISGGGMLATAIDTDFAEIGNCSHCKVVRLGENRFSGYGSGGNANMARNAAEDVTEELRSVFNGASVAVIVTGLGGGTGSGVTPILLRVARTMNIRTLTFAILPFEFEGLSRIKTAQMACPQIDEAGDVVVLLENDKLYAEMKDLPVLTAFQRATETIETGLSLLWRLITMSGYIKIDASGLSSLILKGRGRAVFASAKATGQSRMEKALADIMDHSTMGVREVVSTVPALLVGIEGGEDIRLREIDGAMAKIDYQKDSACKVFVGTVFDPTVDNEFSIVTLAFKSWVADVEETESKLESIQVSEPNKWPGAQSANQFELPRLISCTADSKFALKSSKKSHFSSVGDLIYKGVDLNLPAYQRRNIQIDDKIAIE